jgi:SH3-like domain-containing protein
MSIARSHPRGFRLALGALLALLLIAAAPVEKTPRFVSLRADEVNLRAGPGERYPIKWVYHRKGLPVEVTGEFDVWRKIRDSDGTVGWVQERMIAATRSVIVAGGLRTLRDAPDPKAPAVARAEAGVIARLVACRGAWCRLEAQGITGWLPRDELWGVYPDEVIE